MGVQVCAEVAIVILDENTPASRSWFTWRDILHLVDIICCCAILFPIVWSIKHLREAAGVRTLTHLQSFIPSSSGHVFRSESIVCILHIPTKIKHGFLWCMSLHCYGR